MSKIFICVAIPDEQAIKKIALLRWPLPLKPVMSVAPRKISLAISGAIPGSSGQRLKFIVCEDKPGIPRPALDSWEPNICRKTAGMWRLLPLSRSN